MKLSVSEIEIFADVERASGAVADGLIVHAALLDGVGSLPRAVVDHLRATRTNLLRAIAAIDAELERAPRDEGAIHVC